MLQMSVVLTIKTLPVIRWGKSGPILTRNREFSMLFPGVGIHGVRHTVEGNTVLWR